MSAKTIAVTPISGIPTPINVDAIKDVKYYQDVYHHDMHGMDEKEKHKAVIILDANITGELSDEHIKVDESVEEIKAMLTKFENSEA